MNGNHEYKNQRHVPNAKRISHDFGMVRLGWVRWGLIWSCAVGCVGVWYGLVHYGEVGFFPSFTEFR
jgi:hypothetical protein